MSETQHNEVANVPYPVASFGTLPHSSEDFRTLPNDSEGFRNIPKPSERTENHILTVREAARIFEEAGVSRTERSITNWCQPSKAGVPKLDAYFDSNDRKYFITPQSVDAAIKEELAKQAARHSDPSESFGRIPPDAEKENRNHHSGGNAGEVEELRFKLRESEISSKVKDQYIEKLEKRYDETTQNLLNHSRLLGQLEGKLKQMGALEAPQEEPALEASAPRRIHVISEERISPSEIE